MQNDPNQKVTVTAGAGGDESQDFARILREMYAEWDGTLEHEPGVHRLVRISPFDPEGRRHTAFAGVEVEGIDTPVDDGSRGRSYVLHPYKLAKDYGLCRETEEVEAVLAGDLTPLLNGRTFKPTPPLKPRRPTAEDAKRANEWLEEVRDENGRLPWDDGYEGDAV